MKTTLYIIAIMLLTSIDCLAQNTSKKDSLIFEQIKTETSADTSIITITVDKCLLMYFTGYINGTTNYEKKGSFDFKGLLKEIQANKRTINAYQRFLIEIKQKSKEEPK